MSLYETQKLLYHLNREPKLKASFLEDHDAVLRDYGLTEEEAGAVRDHDIGLLYVLGVNGQILMHFAAMLGIAWSDYLQLMRDGVERHGPVRAGVYKLSGYEGVEAHDRALREKRNHKAKG